MHILRIERTASGNKRVSWIDFAKVLSITLVVLGHVPIQTGSPFVESLRAFRMPLVYPRHSNFGVGYSFENVLLRPVLGLVFGNGYHTQFSTMVNLFLWFLSALMVVKLLHALLVAVSKGDSWIYGFLTGLVVLAFVVVNKILDVDLFFSIDSSLLAFPFFAAGSRLSGVVKDKTAHALSLKRLVSCLSLGLFLFYLILEAAPFNGRIDIDHCFSGNSLGLFYMIDGFGVLSLVLLSQWYVWNLRLVKELAKGTIIILTFHGWVTKILLDITGYRESRITADTRISTMFAITISVATVLALIPAILIVKKFFPYCWVEGNEKDG